MEQILHGEDRSRRGFRGTSRRSTGKRRCGETRAGSGIGKAPPVPARRRGNQGTERVQGSYPVAEVLLFEVIEIIPITEKAAASIAIVPEWRS